MIYGSVCSGIEAASVAWHPLGWQAAFLSEIEPFPRAVLKHHWDVPLHGDFTTIKENDYGPIQLLVGGTPCQSFSVAGLRKGMDDDRGNLALEFLKLAQRKRATWVVWENVPGVLSSNEGRDFGSFLGGLAQLGYGFAYRVLDAQYFRVAQRRRRVFVIGYLGDWRPAAAVLFEQESLRGHPAPSRESRKGIAPDVAKSTRGNSGGIDREDMHTLIPDVVGAIDAHEGNKWGSNQWMKQDKCLPVLSSGQANAEINDNLSPALNCNRDGAPIAFQTNATADQAVAAGNNIAPSMTSNSGGTPSIAIRTAQTGANGIGVAEEVAHTLDQAQGQAVAFAQNSRDEVRLQGGDGEIAGALSAEPGMKQTTYVAQAFKPSHYTRGKDGAPSEIVPPLSAEADKGDQDPVVLSSMQVRRLTPTECERLQGFPDNYTKIAWRKRDAVGCPDGPRYKAIGNSMAVPVMHWIGKRIQMVEDELAYKANAEVLLGMSCGEQEK